MHLHRISEDRQYFLLRQCTSPEYPVQTGYALLPFKTVLFFLKKIQLRIFLLLPFPRALFSKKGRKNLRIFTIPVLYRKAPVLSSIPRRKKGPENVEKTAGKFKFPHGFFAAFFLISVSYFSSGKRSLYRLVTICVWNSKSCLC